MSNSDADHVANLKIFIERSVKTGIDDSGTPLHETRASRCSVPVHYTWITPENCRSLAFLRAEKFNTPSVVVTDEGEADSIPSTASDAFSFLMQRREDSPTDAEATGSGDTFQFSDDEDAGEQGDAAAEQSDATAAKRDRLEISSAANDVLFEDFPENFDQLPDALQEEFRELRTIPVVSKSQEARISTLEDAEQEERKKWNDSKSEATRDARFAYEIPWDTFMPNLSVLRQTQMLMIGGVDFSNMFRPVLDLNKKSLNHTERIFEDIAKNTYMPRDQIFLKIPFPGAKKKDGCRAIPFGFLPLVLHYLRPANLRDGIVLKKSCSLLLRCYRDVVRYFGDLMPPIVKRQLRQFANNMSVSLLGPIGDPLALLSVRSGFVDTDVSGEGVDIESVSSSEEQPNVQVSEKSDAKREEDTQSLTEKKKKKKKKKNKKKRMSKKKEKKRKNGKREVVATAAEPNDVLSKEDAGEDLQPGQWPVIGDHDFTDGDDDDDDAESEDVDMLCDADENSDDEDEDSELDGFIVHDEMDDQEMPPPFNHEPEEGEDIDSANDSMEIDEREEEEESEDVAMDNEEPHLPERQTSTFRSAILEDRYSHHTDDELDALITHYLQVVGELNEVRRVRRVANRSLREKMQSYTLAPNRGLKKPKSQHRTEPRLPEPSRKRKRPSASTTSKGEKERAKEEKKTLLETQPPAKRVAVASKSSDSGAVGQKPKKKLRVYRLQSTQLMSSIPEAIEWTGQILTIVTKARPQLRHLAAGKGARDEVEDGDDEDIFSDDAENFEDDDDDEDDEEGESLGSEDSDSELD